MTDRSSPQLLAPVPERSAGAHELRSERTLMACDGLINDESDREGTDHATGDDCAHPVTVADRGEHCDSEYPYWTVRSGTLCLTSAGRGLSWLHMQRGGRFALQAIESPGRLLDLIVAGHAVPALGRCGLNLGATCLVQGAGQLMVAGSAASSLPRSQERGLGCAGFEAGSFGRFRVRLSSRAARIGRVARPRA